MMHLRSSVRTLSFAAVLLLSLAVPASSFGPPDPSLSAVRYDVRLVQATEECTAGVPLPVVDGCTAATGVTTDGTRFDSGRLRIYNPDPISPLPLLQMWMDGPALVGKGMRARVVLRSTSIPPVFSFTGEDTVLLCPGGGGSMVGPGTLAMDLTSCDVVSSAATVGVGSMNKEVLSASIVDAITLKPIAVPGVRKQAPSLSSVPSPSLNAHLVTSSFVQAMDPCIPPGLFNFPPVFCSGSNIATDGTRFSSGALSVVDNFFYKWRLSSAATTPSHALAGKGLQVQLRARVTTLDATPFNFTYEDQILACPCVIATPSGSAGAGGVLTSCGLDPTLATVGYQLEIQDAAVIDCGTMEKVAVFGTGK